MKKNTKITVIICAAVIAASAVIFGGIALHDKSIIKNAKDSLSVTDVTIELQKSNVTVTVDDVLTKNNTECTALFSNNAGSVEIDASEVKDYTEQLTISLLKPILLHEEIKLDCKISITDTTAPEFTESIEEIKIIEGEEINIAEHFKAADLSGEVNITATEIDTNKIGEQTVTVTATDKSNNSSSREVTIIVEAKPEETPSVTKNDKKGSTNKPSGNSSSNASNSSSSSSSTASSSGSSSSSASGSEDKKPEEKNVSPKDVQKKVNAYIKSKGITVDSSMTPSNASWSYEISGLQEDLNNGYTLKTCKQRVDREINNLGKETIVSMYCYYSGNDFYILYW